MRPEHAHVLGRVTPSDRQRVRNRRRSLGGALFPKGTGLR